METLTKEQVIDALKQAYAVEQKFPRGNVCKKNLEACYNALITVLDDIFHDGVNLFEYGVAADILFEQNIDKDGTTGPFHPLARYAYSCAIEDITKLAEQAQKANGGPELRYGLIRNLVARTIDTIAARCGN